MKLRFLLLVSPLIIAWFGASPSFAGSPEQAKDFTDKYKTAFEAKDSATLESFLYAKDADPMVLEFYKMMIAQGAGGKISKIEVVELSPEDTTKAEATHEGPGGDKVRLPIKATKKFTSANRLVATLRVPKSAVKVRLYDLCYQLTLRSGDLSGQSERRS